MRKVPGFTGILRASETFANVERWPRHRRGEGTYCFARCQRVLRIAILGSI